MKNNIMHRTVPTNFPLKKNLQLQVCGNELITCRHSSIYPQSKPWFSRQWKTTTNIGFSRKYHAKIIISNFSKIVMCSTFDMCHRLNNFRKTFDNDIMVTLTL